LSILGAVYAGWESDLGPALANAFGPTASGPAKIIPTAMPASVASAAQLMAAWSMALDFDDVMLGGHTGHSSVLVPFALASTGGYSGADLLEAQIIANELSARVNMACALSSTRGQMATHLHLLGAAAARAKLEAVDDETFTEALSLALSYPSQALFPAFLGSDAKALCAALPIRVGCEAVDAARAGLHCSADMLQDSRGFFATASRAPITDFLGGLGERWHTETNSFKIYPACGYLCAALDATIEIVGQHDLAPADVASVKVFGSLFTVGMDAHSRPYLKGGASHTSTLTFSTPFTIASAIIARAFTPAQLKRSWISDAKVWELAARVSSCHDVDLTIAALTADIPIGAALHCATRRQAASFGWKIAGTAFGRRGRLRPATLKLLAALIGGAGNQLPLTFEQSTKPIGARVEIRTHDGRLLSATVKIPRGFAGAASANGSVRALMREKFMACADPVIGGQRAEQVVRLVEKIETLTVAGMAELLELARIPAPNRVHNSFAHTVGDGRASLRQVGT
jgi:2-methylcitrate dehydratase PrpD